jgi:hypothetical protein
MIPRKPRRMTPGDWVAVLAFGLIVVVVVFLVILLRMSDYPHGF